MEQSPWLWLGRSKKTMVCLGYNQIQRNHTLFFKLSQEGKLTILLIYVDDTNVTCDELIEIQKLN